MGHIFLTHSPFVKIGPKSIIYVVTELGEDCVKIAKTMMDGHLNKCLYFCRLDLFCKTESVRYDITMHKIQMAQSSILNLSFLKGL